MNFSVLISIYIKENPTFLRQALNSVFNQTLIPTEVILVKDGLLTRELDITINEYQNKYSRLKVISLSENKGLGFALNEGLKHCSYEWVARMDTDDICFPDRFEKQIKIIKQYPEISFFGSTIAEFTDSIQDIVSYRNLPENHLDILEYAKTRCPLNHPTVLYKKDAVIASGGYREFPEDYHLWIRALMKGYKFYNIQEPLLYFRTNLETIKRRGGWKYAIAEINHQNEFRKMGFISLPKMIKNASSRFIVRILPSKLRLQIYKRALRSKSK